MTTALLDKERVSSIQKDLKRDNAVDIDDCMYLIRSLEHERSSYESDWIDLRDNIYPVSGRPLDGDSSTNKGRRSFKKVMDSAVVLALRRLVAGMQSGMVSPSRQWFQLGLHNNPVLSPAVKQWLSTVREILLLKYNQADIYGTMCQLFREMAIYGQGVILIEEHLLNGFKFTCLTCGDYWLDANKDNEVDTLLRKIYFSSRDLIREFGEGKIPEEIKSQKNNVEKKYEVLHIIKPREFYDGDKKDKNNFPWEEIYLLKGSDSMGKSSTVLRTSGYRKKPFVAPRWEKVQNEVYGVGIGTIAYNDILVLYKLRKEGLNAVKKECSPPVTASGRLQNGSTIDLSSNGVTFVPSISADSQVMPVYTPKGVYPTVESAINGYIEIIRELFYNDVLTPILQRDKSMSATEVNSINSEKITVMTPVIELLEKEALDHIFERCFNILWDLGDVLPPPPPELEGTEIKVDYISVLGQAQKRAELSSLLEMVSNITMLYQINPSAVDWPNVDKIARKIAEVLSCTDMLYSEDEVKEIRKKREDLQRMQQARQEALQAIPAMKDASEINADNLQNLAKQTGLGE